jgi:hypothetical protein
LILPENVSIAKSVTCFKETFIGRPILGSIIINFQQVTTTGHNELYLFPIILHQFLHLLGFSYESFNDFFYDNTTRHVSEVLKTITIGISPSK